MLQVLEVFAAGDSLLLLGVLAIGSVFMFGNLLGSQRKK